MGSSVYTNKSSSYLHSTTAGCNTELQDGGGKERKKEREKTIFLFGLMVAWERRHIPLFVFHSGLFHLFSWEGYLNQLVAEKKRKEKEKPKPSYSLSARSCHLTYNCTVFSLSTPTGIFASFLPSKRISKIPLLIHFVSLFSRFICLPFVRVFPHAFVNVLKGKVMICWDHLVEGLPSIDWFHCPFVDYVEWLIWPIARKDLTF